jgi:hypothetical protein
MTELTLHALEWKILRRVNGPISETGHGTLDGIAKFTFCTKST